MAYSDYGGYAYRNGERRIERSDAVLSKDLVLSTPGMWPGWAIPEGRQGGSYHVLLGDGELMVGLYKQSTVKILRRGQEVPLLDAVTERIEGDSWEHHGKIHFDCDPYKEDGLEAVFKVDGWTLRVRWTEEDNHYVYARLEEPDGTLWHGWSGYGVGAGLEDADYGFSSIDRDDTLLGYWPDAIRQEKP